MKIEVLGTGCRKCELLAAAVKTAASQLGIQYELAQVKDLGKIAAYGVLMTPALVIDGEVKLSGKVPSAAELTTLLARAAAK